MKIKLTRKRLGRKPLGGAYTASPRNKESRANLKVFKERDKWRWVSISSNSYIDSHQEIVARKALERSVERQDCGDLLWWHEEKMKLGVCDFQMMVGKMLVESGTFDDPEIAERVSKSRKPFEMSIGFDYRFGTKKGRVYLESIIVERSLLPKGTAANSLTRFWS